MQKRREANLSAFSVNWSVLQIRRTETSSPGRTRTYDKAVNSRLLYQLSYRGKVMAGGNSVRVASECGKVSSPAIQFKCFSGIASHMTRSAREWPENDIGYGESAINTADLRRRSSPGALSHPGSRVGEENGVRYQKPERPKGCFAFLVPDPLFRRMIQPHFLAVTKHQGKSRILTPSS